MRSRQASQDQQNISKRESLERQSLGQPQRQSTGQHTTIEVKSINLFEYLSNHKQNQLGQSDQKSSQRLSNGKTENSLTKIRTTNKTSFQNSSKPLTTKNLSRATPRLFNQTSVKQQVNEIISQQKNARKEEAKKVQRKSFIQAKLIPSTSAAKITTKHDISQSPKSQKKTSGYQSVKSSYNPQANIQFFKTIANNTASSTGPRISTNTTANSVNQYVGASQKHQGQIKPLSPQQNEYANKLIASYAKKQQLENMVYNAEEETKEYMDTEEFDMISSDDDEGKSIGPHHARVLANHIAKYMTPKNKLLHHSQKYKFISNDSQSQEKSISNDCISALPFNTTRDGVRQGGSASRKSSANRSQLQQKVIKPSSRTQSSSFSGLRPITKTITSAIKEQLQKSKHHKPKTSSITNSPSVVGRNQNTNLKNDLHTAYSLSTQAELDKRVKKSYQNSPEREEVSTNFKSVVINQVELVQDLIHYKKQQEKTHQALKKQLTFNTEDSNNLMIINQGLQKKIDFYETKRVEFEKQIKAFRIEILKVNQERLAKKDIFESELFTLDNMRQDKEMKVNELKEACQKRHDQEQKELQDDRFDIKKFKQEIDFVKEQQLSLQQEYKSLKLVEQERIKEVKNGQKKLTLYYKQNICSKDEKDDQLEEFMSQVQKKALKGRKSSGCQ